MSNQQPDSLVKYDIPILVSTSVSGKKGTKKKNQQLAPLEKTATTRNEDYLNSILPPREYTENGFINIKREIHLKCLVGFTIQQLLYGQLWVRYVSPTPATRVDVINLQDELDKLQARQARETGICPIREELYAQCFDELIRQITIQCAERGFLLVRVRDEIKMTIQAYQTLYESSIAYGMRKALMAEQKKNEMQTTIKQLDETCDELSREVERLEQEIDDVIRRDEEERQREQKAHEDQVQYLKDLNQDYKNVTNHMFNIKMNWKHFWPHPRNDDANQFAKKSCVYFLTNLQIYFQNVQVKLYKFILLLFPMNFLFLQSIRYVYLLFLFYNSSSCENTSQQKIFILKLKIILSDTSDAVDQQMMQISVKQQDLHIQI